MVDARLRVENSFEERYTAAVASPLGICPKRIRGLHMQLGYSRTLLRKALGVLASSHMLVCPPGFFLNFGGHYLFFPT